MPDIRSNPSSADAWPILRAAAQGWLDDKAASMGAALAFYTLFSMAPLLLIAIAVAGLAFGADAARGEIVHQLAGVVGHDAAQAVQTMLDNVKQPAEGLLSALTGLVLMLVGATTVLAELQDDLDRIWRAPAPVRQPWWTLLRTRLLSFSLILGLGFLLMVSMLASAAIAALQAWSAQRLGSWGGTLGGLNLALNFAFVTVLFAMLYKLLPRVHIAWSDVWTGAVFTALLFTVGRLLIGAYLANSAVVSGYGAAGSLVAILVWVYYSAQIFLLGAEFTWAYAHHAGSLRRLPEQANAAASYTPTPPAPMPLHTTANYAEPIDSCRTGPTTSGIGAAVDQPERTGP